MIQVLKPILLPIYGITKKLLDVTGIKLPAVLKSLNKKFLAGMKTESIDLNGDTLYLDESDSLLLSVNGVYEPYETELVSTLVKPGDTVIDVGANIGYYTLQFAQLVGPQGRVIAFEPDPINYQLLVKNITENGYKNVTAVNKAVSDSKGTLKLYINEENRGDNRMYDSSDDRSAVSIETVALDEFLAKQQDSIDFIKMDIQGAEILALKGMKNILSKNKNLTLISEFWPIGIQRIGGKAREYIDILEQSGFEVQEIVEDKKRLMPVDDASKLLEAYTVENELYTNLLCTKKD